MAVWIVFPVFLIFLLIASTPLTFTLKKDDVTILSLQTVLFTLTFLPDLKKSRKRSSTQRQNVRNNAFSSLSAIRSGGRDLFRFLRKIDYCDLGTDFSLPYDMPLLTGGIFAVLCPAVTLIRGEISDFRLFSLPENPDHHALYLSFRVSLFAVSATASSFLFHTIRNEIRKGKKNAAGSHQ